MRYSNLLRTSALLASVSLSSALLVGCADRGMNVPPTATLAASGNGTLNYTAPHDGTFYVYDRGNDQLVWSGPVLKGQMFMLDRDNDRLLIDGRVVQDKTPGITNEHRVFFDAGNSVTTRTEVHTETHTVPSY